MRKLAILMVVVQAMSVAANAAMIGPGSGIAATGYDGVGTLNVSQGATYLEAGTYIVEDFSFNAMVNGGTVTPALLIGSPSSYTVVWTHAATAVTSTGINTDTYTGESFTLSSAQNIYAGYSVSDGARIGFNDNGDFGPWSGIPDDLYVSPWPSFVVGQTISGFTLEGFERTYAYEINVTPEPTTIIMLAIGGVAGLIRRR